MTATVWEQRQREYHRREAARSKRLARREEGVRAVVGAQVGRRRAQLGLSLPALADAAGVSERLAAGIEQGRESPSLLVLVALARALRCRPSDLVRGIRPARYRRTPRPSPVGPGQV